MAKAIPERPSCVDDAAEHTHDVGKDEGYEMAKYIIAAETVIDELRNKLAAARKVANDYASHHTNCDIYNTEVRFLPCSCGLAQFVQAAFDTDKVKHVPSGKVRDLEVPVDEETEVEIEAEVDEDDWDAAEAAMEAPPRPSGTINVKLESRGRGSPLSVEAGDG